MLDPVEMQQAAEQAEAALKSMAQMLGSYYRELKKEGFSSREALTMVIEYQKITFGGGQK